MKNNPSFFFEVDRPKQTILVKRVFNASLPLVWNAWTEPALLDQWWASDGWKSQTKSMEFKEGGYRHYVMEGPEGEKFWGLTSFLEIKLHDKFSGKERFVDEHKTINKDHPQSAFDVKFFSQKESTLIEYRAIYQSLEALESSLEYGFERGTTDAYARLDTLLQRVV